MVNLRFPAVRFQISQNSVVASGCGLEATGYVFEHWLRYRTVIGSHGINLAPELAGLSLLTGSMWTERLLCIRPYDERMHVASRILLSPFLFLLILIVVYLLFFVGFAYLQMAGDLWRLLF